MKPFVLFTLVLLGLLAICQAQEATLQTLPAGMVIDPERPRETERTVEQAVTANRTDILYLVLHNGVRVNFCLDHLKDLERTKQAQLLSRLLLDDTFIEPGDKAQNYPVSPPIYHRQIVVQALALALL